MVRQATFDDWQAVVRVEDDAWLDLWRACGSQGEFNLLALRRACQAVGLHLAYWERVYDLDAAHGDPAAALKAAYRKMVEQNGELPLLVRMVNRVAEVLTTTGLVLIGDLPDTPAEPLRSLLWAQVPGFNPAAPRYNHAGDVGLDLQTQEGVTCLPGVCTYIPLGVRVRFPDGVWGLLCGRSSAMAKRGIWVVAGVIDNGYTGPLLAGVVPVGPQEVWVEAGARIAQLLLLPMLPQWPAIVQVEELPTTGRGDNGFGSTG